MAQHKADFGEVPARRVIRCLRGVSGRSVGVGVEQDRERAAATDMNRVGGARSVRIVDRHRDTRRDAEGPGQGRRPRGLAEDQTVREIWAVQERRGPGRWAGSDISRGRGRETTSSQQRGGAQPGRREERASCQDRLRHTITVPFCAALATAIETGVPRSCEGPVLRCARRDSCASSPPTPHVGLTSHNADGVARSLSASRWRLPCTWP